jgi:hypothetical protein
MRSRHSLRADTSPLSASSTAFRLRALASPSSSVSAARVALWRAPRRDLPNILPTL